MNAINRAHPIVAPNFSQSSPQATPLDEISRKALQILQAPSNSENREEVIRHFAAITPNQLQQVLDAVFQKFTEGLSNSDDFCYAINQLAEMLSLEKLQLAIPSQNQAPKDALKIAKDMFEEALYYLNKTDCKIPSSIHTTLSILCDSAIAIIENILSSFGIAQLFKPAENDIHAEVKGQKIMMLMSLFSLLSTSLLPLLGEALAGMIIGGSLLFISTLSIIFPYLRPAPLMLPKGENWSRQMQLGELLAPDGRKDTLDRIANALITNVNGRNHPLLLGKAGIGKTETVKAFVKAIERGDYPELKGKQVFYFNTADLVNNAEMFGNGNKILEKISEAMGSHRKNIILIFDEIHLACQKKENNGIGDQLKTMLQSGIFPNVIGITTHEEFYRDIFSNNEAFADRFETIPIDNTNQSETLEILNSTLLRQAPHAILAEGAFQHLLEKTAKVFSKGAPQPGTALKILTKCIQRTAKSQKSPLEIKIEKIYAKIRSLYSQGAVAKFSTKLSTAEKKRRQEIHDLQEKLKPLEVQLRNEKVKHANFFKTRDKLSELKSTMFRIAVKASSLQPNALSPKDKSELAALLMLRYFLTPQMEAHVIKQSEELGIQTVVDSTLINAVIREKQENDKKAKLARELGKEQIKEKQS
jgi:ATP-dependent Clp protease ATP-binding subunit ClpA